jgi:hypothetical protein
MPQLALIVLAAVAVLMSMHADQLVHGLSYLVIVGVLIAYAM